MYESFTTDHVDLHEPVRTACEYSRKYLSLASVLLPVYTTLSKGAATTDLQRNDKQRRVRLTR